MWNLIEFFKSYSFRRQFRIQFAAVFNVILLALLAGIMATSLEIRRSLIETSKIINEISVKFWLSFLKVYSFRRRFRRQFAKVFNVILQVPSAGITATSL